MAHGYPSGLKQGSKSTKVIVENPLATFPQASPSTPPRSLRVERNERRLSLCERLAASFWSSLGYETASAEFKDVETGGITEVPETGSPKTPHKRTSILSAPRGSISSDAIEESKGSIDGEDSPSSIRRVSVTGKLDVIKSEFYRFINLVRGFRRLETELLAREEALKAAPAADMTGLEMASKKSTRRSDHSSSSADSDSKSDEESEAVADYHAMSLEELHAAHTKAIADILQTENDLRKAMNRVFIPHLTSCGGKQCFRAGPAKLDKEAITELSNMSRTMLYEMEQLRTDARFRRRPSIANALLLAMYAGLRIGGGLMWMYIITYNRYTYTPAYLNEMHYTPEQADQVADTIVAYISRGAIGLFFLTTLTGVWEQLARGSIKAHSKLGDLVGVNGAGLLLMTVLQIWFKDVGWPYYAGIGGALLGGALMVAFTRTELNAARRQYSEYLPYPASPFSRAMSIWSAANSGIELPFMCEVVVTLFTLSPNEMPFTANILLSLSAATILGVLGASRNKWPYFYHLANTFLKAFHYASYAPLAAASVFANSDKYGNNLPLLRTIAIATYAISLAIALPAVYSHGDTLSATNAAKPPTLDTPTKGEFSDTTYMHSPVRRVLDFTSTQQVEEPCLSSVSP